MSTGPRSARAGRPASLVVAARRHLQTRSGGRNHAPGFLVDSRSSDQNGRTFLATRPPGGVVLHSAARRIRRLIFTVTSHLASGSGLLRQRPPARLEVLGRHQHSAWGRREFSRSRSFPCRHGEERRRISRSTSSRPPDRGERVIGMRPLLVLGRESPVPRTLLDGGPETYRSPSSRSTAARRARGFGSHRCRPPPPTAVIFTLITFHHTRHRATWLVVEADDLGAEHRRVLDGGVHAGSFTRRLLDLGPLSLSRCRAVSAAAISGFGSFRLIPFGSARELAARQRLPYPWCSSRLRG